MNANINADSLAADGLDRLDRITGCLIGGAAGDALGYAVEFDKLKTIRKLFGPDGITSYELDAKAGSAIISDDTQMTLFTAEGIMAAMDAGITAPADRKLYRYVHSAYLDWYKTQTGTCGSKPVPDYPESRLLEIPELFARRAPGITCMNALSTSKRRALYKPINNSKGCGGIMRVAPAGLLYPEASPEQVVEMGAEISAITHGHPYGCFPSGIFAAIVQQAAFGIGASLEEMTARAVDAARNLYGKSDMWDDLEALIDKAVSFAGNGRPDEDNLRELGEGWVAEETLAVSLYCALKYADDFSAAMVASVNHDGDSDSTGAVTGNILGALIGYKAIPDKWKHDLQFHDLLCETGEEISNRIRPKKNQ